MVHLFRSVCEKSNRSDRESHCESGSSSEDSARRSLRRSRSLSRFSRPIEPELYSETDYNRNAPRGKFVNTSRGSTSPFPEISLDDLALEFFSSSSMNDTESDSGVVERKERVGRAVSRCGDIGRWASDTASSRRRSRSVSRSRGDAVSSGSAPGAKMVISSDAGSRRRRSLSVARHQIRDSENSSSRVNAKAPVSVNNQMPSAPKGAASSNRRVGRSRSHKDLSLLHDDYSSHSSALTDDESKDTHFGKNGFEKIIRAAEHPAEDVTNGGLYEAMRKELRHAVQEIRTELNQAIGRNQTALTSGVCLQPEKSGSLQDFSRISNKYATKLEQVEKCKQDLLNEMLLEKQRSKDVSKMFNESPDSSASAVAEKPSRGRKRSTDRSGASKRLAEEAERYFEDFIYNFEDTDISSFDGTRKARDAAKAETYETPARSSSHPVEIDGVVLPWLQWETSHEGTLSGKNKAHTPMTPKTLQWDSEKDTVPLHDPSSYSISSHGSWSPGPFSSTPIDKREEECKANDSISSFDMDEYLKHRNNEELLFEMYRERNRIDSGGLLLCSGLLY
ncbi:hypothetical protein CDL12_00160 [Handroanthus impetiginosus]|uniref:Uncharacterized protein n=1 Tax=Handroanthus impetiginosus TaxID=429701 RepID=A0A2G9IBD3_9LAMI|nr:hypothetical protein CDL12_00160 [Handroanthus impetiginosus]